MFSTGVARRPMTPGILFFYLLLSSSWDAAAKPAATFRQHQLEEAVFANSAQECADALEVHANPDGIVDLTPARLTDVNPRSHRLSHHFAEETHGAPLIL